MQDAKPGLALNQIHQGDCLERFRQVTAAKPKDERELRIVELAHLAQYLLRCRKVPSCEGHASQVVDVAEPRDTADYEGARG